MNLVEKSFVILIISTVTSFSALIELDDRPDFFTTDKLGNCYVQVNGELMKYSKEGRKLAYFTDYSLGALHSIDVSDPMRILLFYKESNALLFLDSKLYQLGEPVYLDKLGYDSASEVCKSKQNAFWLYDSFTNNLTKYGFNPNGELKVINLSQFDDEIQIDHMFEVGSNLYLIKKNEAIWEYDLYNESLSRLPVISSSVPQIISGKVYYHLNKNILKYELESGKTDTIKVYKVSEFEDIRYSADNYYILKTNY